MPEHVAARVENPSSKYQVARSSSNSSFHPRRSFQALRCSPGAAQHAIPDATWPLLTLIPLPLLLETSYLACVHALLPPLHDVLAFSKAKLHKRLRPSSFVLPRISPLCVEYTDASDVLCVVVLCMEDLFLLSTGCMLRYIGL